VTNPICFVLAGPPGLGKSTLITKLQAAMNDTFFVYSTDDEIARMAEERGVTYDEFWSGETMKLAEGRAGAGLAAATAAGQDVIWDQTNVWHQKRAKILNRMKSYRVECVAFIPPGPAMIDDYKAWMHRLKMRSVYEGKTIPDNVLESMVANYVVPKVDEGFDKVIYLNMWGKEIEYRED
jgi:predicted kinase